MSVDVRIVDNNSGNVATVTPFGQLVTTPVAYSTTAFQDMDVINTAYNLVTPVSGKAIVITGVVANANRNVGNDGANVEIYTADSPTSLTPITTIFFDEIAKNTTLALLPLNIIIETGGVWLNAKTDDDDVNLTLLYYYV